VERLNYTEAIEKILNSFCDMVVREGTEVKIIRDRESGKLPGDSRRLERRIESLRHFNSHRTQK